MRLAKQQDIFPLKIHVSGPLWKLFPLGYKSIVYSQFSQLDITFKTFLTVAQKLTYTSVFSFTKN